MRKQAGFTLIEMLIAVTLLMAITTGLLLTMRVSLNAMDHADTRLMQNRRIMGVLRIMEAQVSDMMLASAQCRSQDIQQAGAQVPFFQGEQQTMRFVSSYSLNESARGLPQVLEYQVIPGENGRGVRLIVNENLYAGAQSAGVFCTGTHPDPTSGVAVPTFIPVHIGSTSFVLADKLASCRFEFREPRDPQSNLPQRWVAHWVKSMLPEALRINMAPLEPVTGQLQLQTLTVPIHVNTDPSVKYGD